jgi:hypothetical protein
VSWPTEAPLRSTCLSLTLKWGHDRCLLSLRHPVPGTFRRSPDLLFSSASHIIPAPWLPILAVSHSESHCCDTEGLDSPPPSCHAVLRMVRPLIFTEDGSYCRILRHNSPPPPPETLRRCIVHHPVFQRLENTSMWASNAIIAQGPHIFVPFSFRGTWRLVTCEKSSNSECHNAYLAFLLVFNNVRLQ